MNNTEGNMNCTLALSSYGGTLDRCPYMLRCRNFYCKLFHPDESIENYQKRVMKNMIYSEAQKIIKNPTLLKQYFEKSKFCKYKDSCKLGRSCTYAHSLEEYKPPQCFYREYCTTKNCILFHPWDTIPSYLHGQIDRPKDETVDQFVRRKNREPLPEDQLCNHGERERSEQQKVDHQPKIERAYGSTTILPRPKTFAETLLTPEPKTEFCNNLNDGQACTVPSCPYAHTLWELKPKRCPNQRDCACLLYHQGEDRLDYFVRSGIAKLVRPYHV